MRQSQLLLLLSLATASQPAWAAGLLGDSLSAVGESLATVADEAASLGEDVAGGGASTVLQLLTSMTLFSSGTGAQLCSRALMERRVPGSRVGRRI